MDYIIEIKLELVNERKPFFLILGYYKFDKIDITIRLIFVWKHVTLYRNDRQTHRYELQSFSQYTTRTRANPVLRALFYITPFNKTATPAER